MEFAEEIGPGTHEPPGFVQLNPSIEPGQPVAFRTGGNTRWHDERGQFLASGQQQHSTRGWQRNSDSIFRSSPGFTIEGQTTAYRLGAFANPDQAEVTVLVCIRGLRV